MTMPMTKKKTLFNTIVQYIIVQYNITIDKIIGYNN